MWSTKTIPPLLIGLVIPFSVSINQHSLPCLKKKTWKSIQYRFTHSALFVKLHNKIQFNSNGTLRNKSRKIFLPSYTHQGGILSQIPLTCKVLRGRYSVPSFAIPFMSLRLIILRNSEYMINDIDLRNSEWLGVGRRFRFHR